MCLESKALCLLARGDGVRKEGDKNLPRGVGDEHLGAWESRLGLALLNVEELARAQSEAFRIKGLAIVGRGTVWGGWKQALGKPEKGPLSGKENLY